MNAGPCNDPALAYTSLKRLGNANSSGSPHRQRGFFVPAIRLGLHCQFLVIGESAGCNDRKALRRSAMRFLTPPIPRPSSRFL